MRKNLKKKRLLILLLSLASAICAATACGGVEGDPSDNDNVNNEAGGGDENETPEDGGEGGGENPDEQNPPVEETLVYRAVEGYCAFYRSTEAENLGFSVEGEVDSVTLNGEAVDGAAYRMQDGKIVFKNEYLRSLSAPMNKFTAGTNVWIVMKDLVNEESFRYYDMDVSVYENGAQDAAVSPSQTVAEGIEGNSLAFTCSPSQTYFGFFGATNFGFPTYTFEVGKRYCMEFDVEIKSTDDTWWSPIFFPEVGDVVYLKHEGTEVKLGMPGANVLNSETELIALDNGAYRVKTEFTTISGCVQLEFASWDGSAEIVMDNIVLYDLESVYTDENTPVAVKNGSLFATEAVLNVGNSEVESLYMDGEEISAELYAVTENGVSFKPAFVDTLIGETTLTAVLKDGREIPFKVASDLLFHCEEKLSQEGKNLQFKPGNGATDAVEEVEIDGKSWTHFTASNGSTVFRFSPNTFAFETGSRYEWSFDLKFGENNAESWWAPIFTGGSYDMIYMKQNGKGVLSALPDCFPAEGDVSPSYTFTDMGGYYRVTLRFFAREKNGTAFQYIEMASWDGACDIYLSDMSLKKMNYIHTPVLKVDMLGDNLQKVTLASGERKTISFSRELSEESLQAIKEALNKEAGTELSFETQADSITLINNGEDTVTFEKDVQLDLVSIEGYVYKNILIVDADSYTEEDMYGYVMAHFTNGGEAKGKETLHMAVSHDGLNWISLNGGAAVYESPISRIRDPYICRGNDGWFHLVGTTDRKIYYARSKDLLTWEDEHFIELSLGENFVDKCWAPEFVFDPETNLYRLSWVDNIGNKNSGAMMHIAYTSNFYEVDHFSFAILDDNIDWFDFTTLYHNGLYYVSYFRGQAINIAVSESASGPFRTISTRIPGSTYENGIKMTEAPITIKLIGQERFQTYWDYTLNPDMGWGVATSPNLTDYTAVNPLFTNYSSAVSGDACPFKDGIRHGSIFTVTKAEMDALLDAYELQDAPLVSFTGVADGETVSAGDKEIAYEASAEAGVAKVEVWLDQELVHTGTQATGTVTLALSKNVRITVVAYDTNGNRTVSYKDVVVS